MFAKGAGVSPRRSGPVVNAPGHPASGFTVTLPFSLGATSPPMRVLCSFVATLRDYAGRPFVNGSIAHSGSINVSVHANTTKQCSWGVTRAAYRQYAPTYMDKQLGLEPVDPAEHPYLLRISVTVTVNSSLVFSSNVDKVLCTPRIGAGSLKKRLFCEARRGQYLVPAVGSATQKALSHLQSTAGKNGCQAAGISRSKWARKGGPNDGVCQESNNKPGCWDGGDCCTWSCYQLNGEFTQLASDGKAWEFAHTCYALNVSSCKDPAIKNLVPQPDFTRPSQPVAFSGTGGAVVNPLESDACSTPLTAFRDALRARSCDLSMLCNNVLFSRLNVDCSASRLRAAVFDANCTSSNTSAALPRCPPRTRGGCQCQKDWSFSGKKFSNHSCGNPHLGGSNGYHTNDWCNIVAGSCATEDGLAHEANGNVKVDGGAYYDDCGTNPVNAKTAQKLEVTWDGSELATATFSTATNPKVTSTWRPMVLANVSFNLSLVTPTLSPTKSPTSSPTTTAPTSSPTVKCTDTDDGATDVDGDACTAYTSCTAYDDKDFVAKSMCCECGGGSRNGSSCANSDRGAKDKDGDGCNAYTTQGFCTDYDDTDFVAKSMCCGCGGGRKATPKPSSAPTSAPSRFPSQSPSSSPTSSPTATPSAAPTATAAPTASPTATPTDRPTATPTASPTAGPTNQLSRARIRATFEGELTSLNATEVARFRTELRAEIGTRLSKAFPTVQIGDVSLVSGSIVATVPIVLPPNAALLQALRARVRTTAFVLTVGGRSFVSSDIDVESLEPSGACLHDAALARTSIAAGLRCCCERAAFLS